jgi:hypothetical protein
MNTKKSSAKKSATRSGAAKRKPASKRSLVAPKGDKRFVRRNAKGEFKKVVGVGRSLSSDKRRKSKTKVAKGQGDRGETR